MELAELELRYVIGERRRREGRGAGLPDGMPRATSPPDDSRYVDGLILLEGIPKDFLRVFEVKWFESAGTTGQMKTIPLLEEFGGDLDAWERAPPESRGGLCQVEERIAIEPNDDEIAEAVWPVQHDRDPDEAARMVRKARSWVLRVVTERMAERKARAMRDAEVGRYRK